MNVVRPGLRIVLIVGAVMVGGWACPLSALADTSPTQQLLALVHKLRSVPRGAVLIQVALKSWHAPDVRSFVENIKWGEASRTDTVLTRHFNPKSGLEERERQITIYLNREQPEIETILDLAHELVHATSRPQFDPYDPSLTASNYIWEALEGVGGEVEAVYTECQVAVEISARDGGSLSRCDGYLEWKNNHRVVSREKVKKDFYRVGNWHSEITRLLGKEVTRFPLLSKDSPKLYSSTGHAPYPISLWREFEDITQAACNNTRNRMQGVAERDSRSPALDSVQSDVRKFIQKRCQ